MPMRNKYLHDVFQTRLPGREIQNHQILTLQITDFLSDYYAIVESAYKSTSYDDDVLLIKYYLDGHTFAAGGFIGHGRIHMIDGMG